MNDAWLPPGYSNRGKLISIADHAPFQPDVTPIRPERFASHPQVKLLGNLYNHQVKFFNADGIGLPIELAELARPVSDIRDRRLWVELTR